MGIVIRFHKYPTPGVKNRCSRQWKQQESHKSAQVAKTLASRSLLTMQQRELATNSKQQKPNKPAKYCQATSPATRKPAIVRGVGGSGETLRCLEMVVHIMCGEFIEL